MHSLSHSFLFRHLQPPSSPPPPPAPSSPPLLTALILLNTAGTSAAFVRALWGGASVVIAADGAANRLRASLAGDAARYLPSYICGDLDSVTGDTLAFYGALGVRIERDACQEKGDLQKSLMRLKALQAERGVRYRVAVLGAFGGRFDQEAQNLNALFREDLTGPFEQVVLLSEECIAARLAEGELGLAERGMRRAVSHSLLCGQPSLFLWGGMSRAHTTTTTTLQARRTFS